MDKAVRSIITRAIEMELSAKFVKPRITNLRAVNGRIIDGRFIFDAVTFHVSDIYTHPVTGEKVNDEYNCTFDGTLTMLDV